MAGGDLTAYIDYDTEQANRALSDLERRNRQTTSTLEREWSTAGDKIVKMFGPGNLLRAGFAGVAAAVGIATAGMREYAKYSEEAAAASDRLAESRSRLLRDIGSDLMELGGPDAPADAIDMVRKTRYVTAGMMQRPLDAFLLANPFTTLFADRARGRVSEQSGRIEGFYDATDAASQRSKYIDRAANARIASASANGDSFSGRIAAEEETLRRIASERSRISGDDLLAGERRRALQAEEIAATDRLNAIERERREEAERRAEAEKKVADAIAKEQMARMMAGERAKDAYAFQERDLLLANARARGEDVAAAEVNLQFDRLKYALAGDTSISPEDRDARRSRLDDIRAERLALLTIGGTEEATARRNFARPGMVGGGFAGVTSILRQAFAPPGASGPNVEVQQLNELRQIRQAVKGGQVARLG